MGAAASVTVQSSSLQLKAFNVARWEYERIKARVVEERLNQLETYECLPALSDSLLARRLAEVYNAALAEIELELTECKNPCVISIRMAELTPDQRKAYMSSVVLAILEREKSSYKPKLDADYSKSFSGSAADTKAEKEAAALMKGEGGSKPISDEEEGDAPDCNPYLRRPKLSRAPKGSSDNEIASCNALKEHDKHILLHLCGMYLKFLGPSGCFFWIHSASKEIVSLRPSNYDEDDDIGGGVAIANEQIAAERDGGKPKKLESQTLVNDGIPGDMRVCTLQDLPATLDEIINKQGKTPLFLDTSVEQKVRAFMEYKHRLQDVSALTVPFGKSGLKRDDVMENCRKSLVGALKSGTMFCLYLGECNIEHADFKKKLCKKNIFPLDVFVEGGRKLLKADPEGTPRYQAIFKEADLDAGKAVVRDTFCTCVVSTLHPSVWYDKLNECLPTGYMVPVYITG